MRSMHLGWVAGPFQCMICNQLAPLYSLKECVMEFPCDASAFRQPFVEAGVGRPRDLPHAPLIE